MTRIAYFDTFSGISGDMVLGALVDAGLPLSRLQEGLKGLGLRGYELSAEKVSRGVLQATRVKVVLPERRPTPPGEPPDEHRHAHGGHGERHEHAHAGGKEPHRHLSDIEAILRSSSIPDEVKEKAALVFRRLAGAEAKVHGIPLESVHFHEVGALDSIVDIAGAVLGLHLLEIDEIRGSPATVGTGTVRCAHGELPLPAPATLELLRDFPVRQRDTGFELTTPTGAAILTALARGLGPMPPLTVRAIGYGAGDDRPGPVPNVLRMVIGEGAGEAPSDDRVILLETSVDDMSPQWIGHLIDRLLEEGALDASVFPMEMKKSRPAHEIRVLAPIGKEGPLSDLLFRETTTFGIRRTEVERLVLERSFEAASTPWGEVRIKVGRRGGKVLSASPEYEDVQRIARSAGVPLKEVHRRALEEYHKRKPADG